MFLRKLYEAHFTIKEGLSLYKEGSPEWQLEQDKMKLLKMIIQFIKTEGVKQAPAKAKLDALMKTHFDYARVASMFNTTVNSIKASISYLSKSIESKVGVDTLDLLLAGDIESARANFQACSNIYNLNDLIIGDIANRIPFHVPKEMDLGDCVRELEFLKSVSLPYIREGFTNLSLEKLILIRYILETSDSRYSNEKRLLHVYILGNMSMEELVVSLK
ncbi:hypothetical protein PBV87_20925 [Niameybacter massiliensis]|uniref:Uncharacterized protein n=1 Tax=Holtiella tumoricola TaxID=3018743 RepID=A0AA42DRV2_9FIRM|nr:hypothetical protein [Holtiella tumoricola]MDA3733941.1 hypothetical protein [Holtiella tumoricola]